MFYTSSDKELNLVLNGKVLGKIRYNSSYNYQEKTARPFTRPKLRMIEQVGRVDYTYLNNFISKSLNDYYQKMLQDTNLTTRNEKIKEYQELYFLWQKITQAIKIHDSNVSSYYDDLVYRLYLNGYRN